MSFMDKYLNGDVYKDAINDAVDLWHEGYGNPEGSLAEYLGMTEAEYKRWVEDPASLTSILHDRWVAVFHERGICMAYANHRGETAIRRIIPIHMWFGSTQWHPDKQWLLNAYDLDRQAHRTFAVASVLTWDVPHTSAVQEFTAIIQETEHA